MRGGARDVLGSRGALLIAHPGHELRVHGILDQTLPSVSVLTDGSGHSGRSRLASSEKVVGAAGCRQGPVFGRFCDRALYDALLAGDRDFFRSVAFEVAEDWVEQGVRWVAGDAVEGYNPAHDVCGLLLRAAAEIARRRATRAIACFDFLLVAPPTGDRRHRSRTDGVCVVLDDATYSRKLAAAQAYAELASEVEEQLARVGESGFRREWLWPVEPALPPEPPEQPPFYERHGRERVRQGVYERVITWADHVRPIAESLHELARP